MCRIVYIKNNIIALIAAVVVVTMVVACSSTSGLPEGSQLYVGQKPVKYTNYERNDHATAVREEMDLVLATPPNGSLFGSSTYRSPFPIGLWIWNATAKDSTKMGNWFTRSFGSKPVLLSNVNPELHAMVGDGTLNKRGYFNGHVTHEIIQQRNPKKAKVAYTVDMGHLWTIDSMRYVNFPAATDSLIEQTLDEAYIKKDDPFDVASLEEERQRITNLFRDHGYYFYEKNNASYLADTVTVPGKVLLRLQMAEELSDSATHPWYIGNITFNLRKSFMEKLTNSRKLRTMTLNYNGSKPAVRLRVLLNNMLMRHGQLYSRQRQIESQRKLNTTGLFSMTNFSFTPRDSSALCDTLDLQIDCTLDKPYDFYVEAYGKGKTSGKFGPEAIVGITRRNAFHGAELLDVNLHGSYEWQTGHRGEGTSSGVNSYEYGAEASLTLPRIVNPFKVPMRKKLERARAKGVDLRSRYRSRRRFYDTPTTVLKASASVINRAEYFKRHVVSGELTYHWRYSAQSAFEFSPLILSYEYMTSRTDSFLRIQEKHPYLKASLDDQFVPKMSFSYSYRSPEEYRNPISWWSTVSEASNLLSVGYAAFGDKWSKKNKTMFKNPYAQFFKIETNFTKLWQLTEHTSLAAHAGMGVVWTYGNSSVAPYTEQFYAGGANTIRAFNVRSIGPGKYRPADRRSSYVEQTGDIKFIANVEYRPRLFGSMYGAVFLDAGNVWSMHDDTERVGAKFEAKNFFKQMAVGTGIGLRYDLTYFILRLDWGIGLHVPYETSKSGFYNIDSFKDTQTFHLAIGLPF